MSAGTWLRPEPEAQAHPAVVVHFPYAGGSSVSYRPWVRLYPDDLGFIAVELPGRGKREAEPAVASIDVAAEQIAQELKGWSGQRIALFGHSLGALLAYEVTRRSGRYGWEPSALVVSGSRAPSEDLGRPRIAHLEHPQFEDAAVELGLASADIAYDPELAAFFMGPLRMDLALCESYPWGQSAKVATRMSVLGSQDDRLVPLSSCRSWQRLSEEPAIASTFSGGHMFIMDSAREVVALIAAAASPEES